MVLRYGLLNRTVLDNMGDSKNDGKNYARHHKERQQAIGGLKKKKLNREITETVVKRKWKRMRHMVRCKDRRWSSKSLDWFLIRGEKMGRIRKKSMRRSNLEASGKYTRVDNNDYTDIWVDNDTE